VQGDFDPGANVGPEKELTVEADSIGRVDFRCKVAVPEGTEHKLLVVVKDRSGLADKRISFEVGPSKDGPWEHAFSFAKGSDRKSSHFMVKSAGDVWIQAKAKELKPKTKIEIMDIRIETRTKQIPAVGGDPTVRGWGKTDLGLYGGAWVGALAALIEETNVPGILSIDPLATDISNPESYPTRLVYNPYNIAKTVKLPVGDEKVDVYGALRNQMLQKGVKGTFSIKMAPKAAVLLVYCPPGGELGYDKSRVTLDGVVIDYKTNMQ
jgi:hypothetical protein